MDEERDGRGEKGMKSIPDTRVVEENLGLHSGEEEDKERVAIFASASSFFFQLLRVFAANT